MLLTCLALLHRAQRNVVNQCWGGNKSILLVEAI